jgi:hypothetical protein
MRIIINEKFASGTRQRKNRSRRLTDYSGRFV